MPALTGFTTSERIIRHAHLFCGIGAGAKGFNMAKARVGNVRAKFVCTGGIDVDPGAIRNFDRLTGARGTVMDLFDRGQYTAFHGHQPPDGWQEETPETVRAALCGPDGIRPDVIFLSAPCKGFSGLLSSKQSATDKYQALNGLTLRGIWLVCEAFKGGPIPIILFENVPRIMTRGRPLLDQISAILRSYNYNVAETVHDCGELGGLAQSRKRFLLIARQREIIPNFIYEPEKKRLRGVGEVIGKLPLPGDPVAGPMHRVPMLQWKTWLRLALVPAGRDWRALNELAVVEGVLRDYGIVPDRELRDGSLGVMGWDDTAGVVVGNQRSPLHGRHSVADPRVESSREGSGFLGVKDWDQPAALVAGASRPGNGAHSVADPRPQQENQTYGQYGVKPWDAPASTVTSQSLPGGGPNSIADPRPAAVEPIIELPQPNDRLVARIIATDNTWHRPFTTMDLCALQSIVDPEEAFYQDSDGTWHARRPFDLESKSDAEKREWIGNAVPSESAEEIGGVIGEALLLADVGETFTLSTKAIWVSPLRAALAVDTDQAAFRMECGS